MTAGRRSTPLREHRGKKGSEANVSLRRRSNVRTSKSHLRRFTFVLLRKEDRGFHRCFPFFSAAALQSSISLHTGIKVDFDNLSRIVPFWFPS